MARIAVIGAGLSGLVAARELTEQHQVVVFEKSRGVGGRMATRYAGDYAFDHGAQFFTARRTEFQLYLRPLVDAGAVTCWNAQFAEFERDEQIAARHWDPGMPHYVGAPGMNAIGKWLADGLEVILETRIAGLVRQESSWQLTDAAGNNFGPFDWIILTAPAPQTTALLPPGCSIREISADTVMLGCYSLMLGDPRPLQLDWGAALVRDADISWISVDSSKPGRGEAFSLLVHSTNEWADAHINADDDWVTRHLLAETSTVLGVDARTAAHCALHRWRYANMDLRDDTPGFAIDENMQLAACGDWFIRGRVEAAFSSAMRLIEALPLQIRG